VSAPRLGHQGRMTRLLWIHPGLAIIGG
jgi:hypothetical protein